MRCRRGLGGGRCIGGRRVGDCGEFLFQYSASLEFHGVFGRHRDALLVSGVHRDARGAAYRLKNSELAKFQPISLPDLLGNFLQNPPKNILHHVSFYLGLPGDLVHDLFFVTVRMLIPFPSLLSLGTK